MNNTYHFVKRMQLRGITKDVIDLVLAYGKNYNDKVVLNKKNARQLVNNIDTMRKLLLRVIDSNGVVVVEKGGSLITTYHITKKMKNDV
ncbi:MAG: hypothetical protein ACUVRK_03305 [Spirochaetota bacterium]